jgi:hypothetical protein
MVDVVRKKLGWYFGTMGLASVGSTLLYENGEEQEGPIWRDQTHAAGLGAAH